MVSSIVSAASVDPNLGATLGSLVYSGNYSWRVEDTVNGGYASAISQQVNNYTAQNIYFAWKAVLEGAHGPTDAATMKITLTDLTTNTVLIDRQYNAATTGSGVDPRFSFDSTTGDYYTANWQIEQLPINASLTGHDFVLSVLASDCEPTGHYGYVYLDGFGTTLPSNSNDIDTAQSFYLASNLGTSLNPVFVGGTLKMDQAGATYSQAFTLDGSSTNTIDENGNVSTFSGVFSEATPSVPGRIIIANSGSGGAVTFSGINSYTGSTTINTGATLALAGSGSIATSSDVLDNGTFDISATSQGAAIRTLSGAGVVTLGTQVLTLTNANGTFSGQVDGTGGIHLLAGTEAFDGTVNGSFLLVDGVLRGVGTINASTIVNGTLAPGDSPGPLTFNAPVTLSSLAIAAFDIEGPGSGTGPGNFSRIVVNGAGNGFAADGVIEPVLRGVPDAAINTYTPPIGQQFVVIRTEGGVTGSFTGLTQPDGIAPGTRFDAIYAPTTLTLSITPTYYGNLELAGLSETQNEAAVGRALDAVRPAAGLRMSDDLASVFYPLYVLTGPQIPLALDELSPSIYGAAMMAARGAWHQMTDVVSGQIAMRRDEAASDMIKPSPHGSTIWIQGIGQFYNVGASGWPDYHSSVGGGMVGIDRSFWPNSILGVAVGGASIQTSSSGNIANGNAVEFSVYGGWQSGRFFVDAQGAYLHEDQHVRRNLTFWDSAAHGNIGLNGGGAEVNAGIRLAYGRWDVEPTLGLSVFHLSGGDLTETGGGSLAEHVSMQSITSVESLAAMRVGTQFNITPTVPVLAHALVGWQHEFADVSSRTTGTLALAGIGSFTSDVQPIARDAARLGARFEAPVSQKISLYTDYQAAVGGGTNAQYLTGGVRIVW